MYDDIFDLYSRAPGLDEEGLKPRIVPYNIPPVSPEPEKIPEPPVSEGFVEVLPKEEPPIPEPPVSEGFVEIPEPPVSEGFVEVPPEEEPKKPEERSLLGRAAAGYRALISPIIQPVQTVRNLLNPPKTYQGELIARVERGLQTGTEETKAGLQQMTSEALRLQQNPYLEKSTEEAKADVPKLEAQIAETEKNMRASGMDPKLAGMEWRYGVELTPEQKGASAKLGDLTRQLVFAKQAVTGLPTESPLGTLSRSFADVAGANRDNKAEIVKSWGDVIDKSHDKDLLMQVADSIGASAPSMGASMMNPVFGLSLMYAQTYEQSRSEFLEKGGDPAKADEYGHKQAALQTPFEIVGDLAFAKLAKNTLKRIVSEKNPVSWANWVKERAVELAKTTAGEVGVTTPAQTAIQQELGEQYGIEKKKTLGEKLSDIWEAQKVAAVQSLALGGLPTVAEAAHRQAILSAPAEAPAVAPPAVAPPGVVPPAETPPESFAPPAAPGVTITPAPGEVPAPPGLTATPPVTPSAVVPPVTGDERFAPPAAPAPVTPPVVAPPVPEPPISPQAAGATVVTKVASDNQKVADIADQHSTTLQAAGAPQTAQAIQQVAARSNTGASVTAAEFLEQAQAAAAAQPPVQPAMAPVEQAAPVAPTQAAPAPTQAVQAPTAPAEQAPRPAVVVGGQQFTGDTHADAVLAASKAVGPDAMTTAVTGWVDPQSGRFVSHEIYDAHQAFNAAIDQAGGDTEHPSVQQAGAQLAEAQARDVEVNQQIVQPGGEQVVQSGVKGQEALIAVRPSQELAKPLAGVNVTVEGVTPEGQRTQAERPAAQALNEARNDRTALTLLLDCLH